jgi:hypothetical protein
MNTVATGTNSLVSLVDLHEYLIQLRDGEIATPASPTVASKVNVQTTASFSFALKNFRRTQASYTLAFADVTSGDQLTIASHSSSGTGCSAVNPSTPSSTADGNLPAAATTAGTVTCNISVTVNFTPGASGTRAARLTATLVSPGKAVTAANLTVTGQTPSFAITPSSWTTAGKYSPAGSLHPESTTQRFTVTNGGAAALDLTALNVSSPDGSFALDPATTCATAGTTNVAGNNGTNNGTCDIVVSFRARTAGAVPEGTLTVSHDAAAPNSVNLRLDGTGTVPQLSPNTLTTLPFGISELNVPQTTPQTLKLKNIGEALLWFTADPSGPLTSTDGKQDFVVSSTCKPNVPLAKNQECNISGTFTAKALGAREATLRVESDGGQLDIKFTGEGSALAQADVAPPVQTYPDTVIGETAVPRREVTITNTRSRAITYEVNESGEFKIDSECPGRQVAGGSSCTLTWRFSPVLAGGEGTRNFSMVFKFKGTLGDEDPGDKTATLSGKALLPLATSAVELRPSAVVGASTSASVTLSNRSTSSIVLTDLVLAGASAADYSLDAASTCAKGGTLAAGTGCTIVLGFKPGDEGAREAKLTLSHTAPGSPQEVKLLGIGTPAPKGRIESSVAGGLLTFADTVLGGERMQPVTLKNAGDAPLKFSAFELGGTHPADFAREGDCSTTAPLAANAVCSITLRFLPKALGDRAAELTVRGDASNTPFLIRLAGKGTPVPAPAVRLEPATLEFGAQTFGGLYPGRTVRLTNTGSAALNLASVSIDGQAFTLKSLCPSSVAAGDGCDLLVAFVPTAADTSFDATLRVTSNAPGSPHIAPLSGRGVAAQAPLLEWSTPVSRLEFGAVSAGALSEKKSLTLVNRGPGGALLKQLNAVGVQASSFVVVGGSCTPGSTLDQGKSCVAELLFAPSSSGEMTAVVQVASSGTTPPAVTLQGTGLSGPTGTLALSSAALDFDETRVGARSLPRELVLTNGGQGAIDVTRIDLSGAFSIVATTCPQAPHTMLAGASCKLSLMFSPGQAGPSRGVLEVTTNGAPTRLEVVLSGDGVEAADLSSGGCSMVSGDSPLDPTLWSLLLVALGVLAYRYRTDRSGALRRRRAGRPQ